jgi:shikimate kinase
MGAPIQRIVLIGLRRSGKTTVGRVVSTKTGWALVDTDALVATRTGRSPAVWINDHGIDAFREVEHAAVAAAASVPNAVVATGGGVPLSEKNREVLRPGALVVYLRVDPWVLAERARADANRSNRPLLAGDGPLDEPFVLFAERDGLYRSFCDVIVDATRPPDVVAASILDALPDHPEPTPG